ncbi:hypothetical protein ACLB2K_049277 [Fragaria x ananassa]
MGGTLKLQDYEFEHDVFDDAKFDENVNGDPDAVLEFEEMRYEIYCLDDVCNSDELESLAGSETEEDEEGNPIKMPTRLGKMKLYPYIRFVEIKNLSFRLWLLFPNIEQLRETVRQCAIRNQIGMWFEKNTKKKMQVKCQWGCPFYMSASNVKRFGQDNMVVKTLNPQHICTPMVTSHFLTYRRVAEEVNERLLVDEDWSRKGIHKHIEDTYNMDIPMQTITREMDGPVRRFKMMYICFKTCKEGWMKGCMPLIRLDGCHIKEHHPGHLLTTIGIDANNEIFPIAYAMVERESEETWKWFLEYLQQDVKILRDSSYVFMTDKQKGLDNTLKDREKKHLLVEQTLRKEIE